MSLSTRFLSLSMKEQICITIIALTIFCIGVILIVCCSLMYEILMNDYEQKKLYFYQRYKEYIQSSFYFQNFYLMQYEENMKKLSIECKNKHGEFNKLLQYIKVLGQFKIILFISKICLKNIIITLSMI